ncbi:patatin-like phospholipase family protein [Pseudoxanthomonas suwonensis]
MLQGARILSLFERKTLHVAAVRDFDELPIPFRAIGTDLNTGQPVELGSGSLALAMRASMSLPGIFQPVRIDGRVLVDGGIAEQVPIDTVRRMGADVVIAVDVGTPLMELGSDASVLQVVSQLTGMLTVGNTRDSVSRLGGRDVLVVPLLGEDVATGDFAKAAEALRIGREAAEAAAPALAALPRWRAVPPATPPAGEPAVVGYVRLENESRYDDQVLTEIVDIPLGRPLDADHLERATLRAYNEGTFASVTYEVERNDEGLTGVVVRAREKPQGPNYLQAGFRTATDFSGTSESSLRLALLRSPATPYGAEARVLLGLGSEPELQGEYYHPFDPQARWYLQTRLGARRTTVPVFDGRGNRVATYEAQAASAQLGLGRTFGRYGAAEIGLERSTGEAEVEVGDPTLPDVDLDAGSWYAQVAVDRLDSLYFPREGHWSRLAYRRSAGWLGGDARFEEAGLDVLAAAPFGRHALQAGLAWHATLSGELPLHLRHRLGGRGRLAGFHYNELAGQHYAMLMAGYSYQLAALFRRSAVVGATVEYGNAWEERGDMRASDGIWNGSLYLGFDSAIGPMLFGYGLREGGEGVLFLEIGKPL